MMTFSDDPQIAEEQMNALIYYLTAFGYIDGDFDPSEKDYIVGYIKEQVPALVDGAFAEPEADPAEVRERWTAHFLEVLDDIDHHILCLFAESVTESESTLDFVLSRLKLRCYELYRRFDPESQKALLGTIDELMMADGVVHPNEKAFRDDLVALLGTVEATPVQGTAAPTVNPFADEGDEEEAEDDGTATAELETVAEGEEEGTDHLDVGEAGTMVSPRRTLLVGAAQAMVPREVDHPFLHDSERNRSANFLEEARVDLSLMERFESVLDAQRRRGDGRLKGGATFADFAGGEPFLDGHVWVVPAHPERTYELLVLGDLHGCYSCLKAALMQADFFGKMQACERDPGQPRMMLVFLGDYIDRGKFSYNGVLRTVMQLFLRYPDNVFVLRGNHEMYIEHDGKVVSLVRPAEAISSLAAGAPKEMFSAYMRLFNAMPNIVAFDRMLFVHGGIPRDDVISNKLTSLAALNDPLVRFQMLWSDPSEVDVVPHGLQCANARFPFGREQFARFMRLIGCTSMIRGHERIIEGFRQIYDDPMATLLSLFSAGGSTNADLPTTSDYRQVTPMALTIRHRNGISHLTPFAIDFERYNDPRYNAFLAETLSGVA